MDGNFKKSNKGLNKDSNRLERPQGTYSFALNVINESEVGDMLTLGNEEGNKECWSLPEGYTPIGKVNIGNDEQIIFSVSIDESLSEIGVVNSNCVYTSHVNTDLNFKVSNQIDPTYRLRRGCDRTVYWVDGDNNNPRYYNLDKPTDFQTNGDWDVSKFKLFKNTGKTPIFDNVEVLDFGGVIEPGSVNICVQYLDEDLNPTEWTGDTPTVNIYNDSITDDFLDINGSINSDNVDFDYTKTSKAIKVELLNLDQSFLFYRLAFIEATNGSGQVSAVKYTAKISTSNPVFIYTGNNFEQIGSEEELLAINTIIDSADSIDQIDNTLILANTRGNQVNYCKLQPFASRIKADLITKKVFTNIISEGNTKNPTVNFEAAGYMPGEKYSFAIFYVLDDDSITPGYHIPGKSPGLPDGMTFDSGENIYPMDSDNQSESNRYLSGDNCDSFWGIDSEGNLLENELVRHHRFPLRSKVGLPLVVEESSEESEFLFYQIRLTTEGYIGTPCSQEQIDLGVCDLIASAPSFQVAVEYLVGGFTQFFYTTINPSEYTNQSNAYELILDELSGPQSAPITIVSINESQEDGTTFDVTNGDYSPHGLSYTTEIVQLDQNSTSRVFSTEVFGIHFSGVELPPPSVTNGKTVKGYYIVRNERTEDEKTILDSAVLTPFIKSVFSYETPEIVNGFPALVAPEFNDMLLNEKYEAHGLLAPEAPDNRFSKKNFAIINPEYKFNDKKYSSVTEIIQEGSFKIVDRKKSRSRYKDVLDGTSYNEDDFDSDFEDEDGWSLKTILRDNVLSYKGKNSASVFDIDNSEIDKIFYLNALEQVTVDNGGKFLYNVSGDNKIGVLRLDENLENTDIKNRLPYVYLKREIANSYSDFRTLPYYKTHVNMLTSDTASVFGGDTYVSPMRYVSTVFWENRIAERKPKSGFWNTVLGVVTILGGIALTIFFNPALGVAVVGQGLLFLSSGIEQGKFNKAYGEEYDKGLRETVLDKWVDDEYRYTMFPTANTPEDDEIQWAADCLTDLWYESQINISLRHKMITDFPNFLDAPGIVENGAWSPEPTADAGDIGYVKDLTINPISLLEKHVMRKLTVPNADKDDNVEYAGHCTGELYNINPDYTRSNKQKVYFHLPFEYDCCSNCQEEFPHRVHYSEQSFQEELSDNYRVFLPNNYRDISGEKGRITDLFTIKNNLYIHTSEALWHLPQTHQERITDDIVSFIGTGGFFAIPPRLILDENQYSGGTEHRWATLKTKFGVFFVSEKENKIFKFDGNQLTTISNIGLSNWFKSNIRMLSDEEYYSINNTAFPFSNNPSNKFGSGFISTYDVIKERIIFSKKDYLLSDEVTESGDFEVCNFNGNMIVFPSYQETISNRENDGWEYLGLEDCRMKFEKTEYETETVIRDVLNVVNNDLEVHVFYDGTGSFSIGCSYLIDQAVDAWVENFSSSNPLWNEVLYKYNVDNERWLQFPQHIVNTTYNNLTPEQLSQKNVLVINFINEAASSYHNSGTYYNLIPQSNFLSDRNDFISYQVDQFASFIGIHYPIVYTGNQTVCETTTLNPVTRIFMAHSFVSIEGSSFNNIGEINSLLPNQNLGFSTTEWADFKSLLLNNDNYPSPGLKNWGWLGKWDRFANDSDPILTPVQFNEDISELLSSINVTEPVEFEIQVPVVTIEYEDGVLVNEYSKADNSWTISHSLKSNSWISWHSFLPNFYYYISNKFFSWKSGLNNMFKHNSREKYQTYYNKKYPCIIEHVSVSKDLDTKIWDDIVLYTEAKRFKTATNEFVDERFITFNKIIAYNSKQCTGELTMEVKDTNADAANYMIQQVVDVDPEVIIIDRNERDWTINDLRDLVVDYNESLFDSDLISIQNDYYIDKKINPNSIDINKSWDGLQSMRDKYLVVRLKFDSFDDVKLLFNYSIENEIKSPR